MKRKNIILTSVHRQAARALRTLGLLSCVASVVYPSAASALSNPAAVYCQALGHKYVIETTPRGDHGVCVFKDGKSAAAWPFLRGEQAPEYSYCALKGYGMRTVKDAQVCASVYSPTCGVCTGKSLPGEVEVTKLMGLRFDTGQQ